MKSYYAKLAIPISMLLGFIFILAASSKLVDLSSFQKTVQGLSLLPQWIRGTAVLLLPGLELTVGLCLLCQIATKEASLIAGCLMIGFLLLSIHATFIGSTADCGCFKVFVPAALRITGWGIVARDFLFLLGCQYVFLYSEKTSKSQPFLHTDN